MKLVIRLLACIALASCSPQVENKASTSVSASVESEVQNEISETARTALIPEAFFGSWDGSAEGCKMPSELRLLITDNRLQFYESAADVRSVTINSATDIVVEADMTGEGERWTETLHMVLSDSGRTLSINNGKMGVRQRCQGG